MPAKLMTQMFTLNITLPFFEKNEQKRTNFWHTVCVKLMMSPQVYNNTNLANMPAVEMEEEAPMVASGWLKWF